MRIDALTRLYKSHTGPCIHHLWANHFMRVGERACDHFGHGTGQKQIHKRSSQSVEASLDVFFCHNIFKDFIMLFLFASPVSSPHTCKRVRIKSRGAQTMLANAPLPAPATRLDQIKRGLCSFWDGCFWLSVLRSVFFEGEEAIVLRDVDAGIGLAFSKSKSLQIGKISLVPRRQIWTMRGCRKWTRINKDGNRCLADALIAWMTIIFWAKAMSDSSPLPLSESLNCPSLFHLDRSLWKSSESWTVESRSPITRWSQVLQHWWVWLCHECARWIRVTD